MWAFHISWVRSRLTVTKNLFYFSLFKRINYFITGVNCIKLESLFSIYLSSCIAGGIKSYLSFYRYTPLNPTLSSMLWWLSSLNLLSIFLDWIQCLDKKYVLVDIDRSDPPYNYFYFYFFYFYGLKRTSYNIKYICSYLDLLLFKCNNVGCSCFLLW